MQPVFLVKKSFERKKAFWCLQRHDTQLEWYVLLSLKDYTDISIQRRTTPPFRIQPSFSIQQHIPLPFLAACMAAQSEIIFPNSLAFKCIHVIAFGPLRCEQTCLRFQVIALKTKLIVLKAKAKSPNSFLFLLIDQKVDVLVTSFDHSEDNMLGEGRAKSRRNLGPFKTFCMRAPLPAWITHLGSRNCKRNTFIFWGLFVILAWPVP